MKVTAKDILAWIKGHIVIVLSVLFILAALPVAFVLSGNWLKSIVTKQQETASQELTKVKAADIEYRMRQVDPATPPVSEKNAPNAALIAHFRKANEQLAASAAAATQKGVNFNMGKGPEAAAIGRSEFKPLVEGVFPKPQLSEAQLAGPNARDIFEEQEALKLNEMEDALLGKRGRPNPYLRLLESVRAGGPVETERLEEIIRDMRAREVEKITSNTRPLTDEESAKLKSQLQDRRLAELQARARSLGLYMTIDALTGPAAPQAGRPRARSNQRDEISTIAWERIAPDDLTRANMFLKQWDLWFLSDIMTAVRLANQGTGNAQAGIDKAVVKRIESIELLLPERMKPVVKQRSASSEEEEMGSSDQTESPPSGDFPAGAVPLDRQRSITGRVRGGWNELYEVRRAKMVCIVSSARLNEFLAAIARTNFMAVTDLDFTEVDSWAALGEGYYYGDEHVVRVNIELESIWLKSWMVPMMPEELRRALGMKIEEAPPA